MQLSDNLIKDYFNMSYKPSQELIGAGMIDPQLENADRCPRDHSKVKIEILANGYSNEAWNGGSNYCLYRQNGEVSAVVKAKKTSVDVRLAAAQVTHYIDGIEKRQCFMAISSKERIRLHLGGATSAMILMLTISGQERLPIDSCRAYAVER